MFRLKINQIKKAETLRIKKAATWQIEKAAIWQIEKAETCLLRSNEWTNLTVNSS